MECHVCHSAIPEEAVYCPHCATQVPGTEECQDYTYEAFISYRHRDLDRGVVKRLQRFLEGLRAPKQLETTTAHKRLGKLFRDEDELPTSASLSEQIETALEHSRYLVVACSPQARESLWVQREVELFASLHGRDRIILALVEGEPDESFPPLLLNKREAKPDGSIQLTPEEPIAADFRAASKKKFKDEALRIAAVLFGCNYDDLRQRMRVRRMRAIAIAAAAVAVVSIAFGSFSLYQQTQIQKNHRTSQMHESELLAAESEKLLNQGDRYQAIQVALRALPETTENPSRPIVPAALLALQRAIGLYPTSGQWSPDYSLPLSTDNAYRVTDIGYLAMITSSEDIDVYNLGLGTKIHTIEKAKLFSDANANENPMTCLLLRNDWLFCSYGTTTFCFEAYTGKLIWKAEGNYPAVNMCTGDETITVLYSDGDTPERQKHTELVSYDAATGKVRQTHKLDNAGSQSYTLITCDDTGGRIGYLRQDNTLFILDLEGKTVSAPVQSDYVHSLRFDDNRIYALVGELVPHVVYVDAFDTDLHLLWTHEEHIMQQWSDGGEMQHGTIAFCGENADDEFPEDIAVSLSSDLVFLNPADGSVVGRNTYESPILDCRWIGEDYFEGVLANGTLFTQTGETDASRIRSESVTTCAFATARFAMVKGIGVFVVGKSLAPTKLAVFHYGDSFVASYTAKEVDWLDENAKVVSDNGNYAQVGKDTVTFLNNGDLKPRASIDTKDLPGIDRDDTIRVAFSSSDEAYLWAKAEGSAEDVVLFHVSIGDGTCKVAGSTKLEGALINEYTRKDNDDRLRFGVGDDIAWQGDDRLVLLNKDNLSTLREIPATAGNAIESMCNGRGTVLLCERDTRYANKLGQYRLVDKSTGQDIASALQDYSFYVPLAAIADTDTLAYRLNSSTGAQPAIDQACERVALSCADRRIRVFNLADGSLIWESSEVPPHLAFIHFTMQGDLLVQDEQGYCSLLAGEDGSIVNSTMLTMPAFNRCIFINDSCIVVGYSKTGASLSRGAALVLTDRTAFGPLIDMPLCVGIAENSQEYLAYDGSKYKTYILTPLDIDGLLGFARSVIEGHELSEAESALYQVEE